jgi:hypothetical protein
MKPYCYLLLLLLFATACQQPKTIFEELEAEDKLEADYHFNASTLRMMNFEDEPSLNKFVKDVDKISLLTTKPAAMTIEEIEDYAATLQTEKKYDLYVEVNGPERQYFLMGDASRDKTIAIISQNARCYIVDITGKVDIRQLPQIYQYLSTRDSTKTDGFAMLFNAMKEDAANEERRREHRRQREAEAAKRLNSDTLLLD